MIKIHEAKRTLPAISEISRIVIIPKRYKATIPRQMIVNEVTLVFSLSKILLPPMETRNTYPRKGESSEIKREAKAIKNTLFTYKR